MYHKSIFYAFIVFPTICITYPKMDVSITKMYLDTSIVVSSNMNPREYM
jgi:hypothetical protein